MKDRCRGVIIGLAVAMLWELPSNFDLQAASLL